MAFDNLPPLPPMLHPGAAEYGSLLLDMSRQAAARCRTHLDQAYGPDPWQTLDIYQRADSKPGEAPLPVLLSLHGGAWMNGYKEWMGFAAPALIDLPLLLVSISYRLAPAVGMADIVADCFDALQWVYRHITDFGGDPDRLFVSGHSAGGHLAALLALRDDLATARGLPANVVKGCFPISATLDLRFTQTPSSEPERRLAAAIGSDLGPWSPLDHLARLAARPMPFHLLWGEYDFHRIVEQNQTFVARLQELGMPVSFEVGAGHDHFSVHVASGARDSPWARQVRHIIANRSSSCSTPQPTASSSPAASDT